MVLVQIIIWSPNKSNSLPVSLGMSEDHQGQVLLICGAPARHSLPAYLNHLYNIWGARQGRRPLGRCRSLCTWYCIPLTLSGFNLNFGAPARHSLPVYLNFLYYFCFDMIHYFFEIIIKNTNIQFVSFLFTDQEQVFILQYFSFFPMFTSLINQCKKKWEP